ncbi:MAG TPA: alpha/beta hydrolase [Candidatus Limnocylindria bacterium]|nr:alpha/beta hydrolase [Candidatus Limnocylindria bacterium]
MPLLPIRDVQLNVEVMGMGPPIVLMHGGPGADLWTMLPFRRLADRFTLVFYDHRCNGRSVGAPVETMTWENLTADADALREALGYERWTVLGHSFGGKVALEYALRHPDRVERLILVNSGGDSRWPQDNAAKLLEARGYDPKLVRLTRRFFNGRIAPREYLPALWRLGDAYHHDYPLHRMLRDLMAGEWHSRPRAEPLIWAGQHLLSGWSVMNRLGEIRAPTLLIAGREDFLFPPEHQEGLAAGIPDARLVLVDGAAHNPQSERPDEVMDAIRAFLPTRASVGSTR